MSRRRIITTLAAGSLSIAAFVLYWESNRIADAKSGQPGVISASAHQTRLADGGDDGGGDQGGGQDDEPGDIIQAPEQQEQQDENQGGPGGS